MAIKSWRIIWNRKKNSAKLNRLNIFTIKDLATTTPEILYPYFKNQSALMINWANGIDNSLVISEKREPKGIGNEITLNHDINNIEELNNNLLFLSEKVGMRIRKQNKYASVIVVILKDNKFKKFSHQKKLETPTNSTEEIYRISKKILTEMYKEEKIRLIGVRLDNLTDKKIKQVTIFDDINEEQKNIDEVIDQVNNKYGNIIKKASLINKKYKDNKKY